MRHTSSRHRARHHPVRFQPGAAAPQGRPPLVLRVWGWGRHVQPWCKSSRGAYACCGERESARGCRVPWGLQSPAATWPPCRPGWWCRVQGPGSPCAALARSRVMHQATVHTHAVQRVRETIDSAMGLSSLSHSGFRGSGFGVRDSGFERRISGGAQHDVVSDGRVAR